MKPINLIRLNSNIYILSIRMSGVKPMSWKKLKYGSLIVTAMFLMTAIAAMPTTKANAEWRPVEHYLYQMQHFIKPYKHIKVKAFVFTCRNTYYKNLILLLRFEKRGSDWRVEWFKGEVSSQSGYIPDYPNDNPFSYYPRKNYASNLNNLFPYIHGISNLGMGSFAPVYNHQWRNSHWKITKTNSYVQWSLACGHDYDYDKHDMGAAYTHGYVAGKVVTFTYHDHATKGWWWTEHSRAHFTWSWTISW